MAALNFDGFEPIAILPLSFNEEKLSLDDAVPPLESDDDDAVPPLDDAVPPLESDDDDAIAPLDVVEDVCTIPPLLSRVQATYGLRRRMKPCSSLIGSGFLPSPPKLIRAQTVDTGSLRLERTETSVWHGNVVDFSLHQEFPVFDLAAGKPLDTVFLLDTTASMEGARIVDAIEAIKVYILDMQTADPTHNVSLFTFDVFIDAKYKNLSVMDRRAMEIDPTVDNNTALYDAIRYVLLGCNLTPCAFIVLTDGEDNSSVTTLNEVNFVIERAKTAGSRFTFVGCDFAAKRQGEVLRMETVMQASDDVPVKACLKRASTDTSAFNRSVSDGSASKRNITM